MTDSPGSTRFSRLEYLGLVLVALLMLVFGVLVVVRSAFQIDRKTDFGVYARAGYAVRAGLDLYEVCDNRGWHYCYPPTFAILMAPLADPYPWDSHPEKYLAFGTSVSIWFLLNVGILIYSAHIVASYGLPDAQTWSRRWWYARLIPVYLCLGGLGYTLSRGQVNILLLGIVALTYVAAVRGKKWLSGFWFSAAVALKVIPGLLVLFPLVRRDWRMILGGVLGGLFWLGALPSLVWGVPEAWKLNLQMVHVVLTPGATGGGDQTREKELTGAVATDSQSFQSVFHVWQYPDRASRPREVAKHTRLAHWLLGGLMILVSMIVAWRNQTNTPASQLVYLGLLCVLMLLLTPVSHMHYYAMAWPLVAGLWYLSLSQRPGQILADRLTCVALLAWCILTSLPLFPGDTLLFLRDAGLATFATVGLWAFGVWRLHQARPI
jgi:alpha-1,2-mannosyltransferase